MPQRSRWALPTVINPPGRLCVLVPVPDEQYHIAAFLGALYELTRWYSWQEDPGHTALATANVWKPIWDALRLQMCADFECPLPIEEWVEEMSLCDNIRFNSDGKLQVLCCGAWVNVDGQPSQGIGGPGQPGGGSGTPGAGQCQTYHAILNGNDQWLAPAVVNAGDTVQISNLQGAWSDGGGLWYCPIGKEFFAGACTIQTLDALDPVPSTGHMALLSKIAGTFTDVSSGTIMTVPGGVSNALLIFQANDHSLSDNGGQITFDVNVCNNAVGSFVHTFDFTLSPHGWDNFGTGAVWTAGIGWQSAPSGVSELLDIESPVVAAFNETRIEVIGVRGSAANGGTSQTDYCASSLPTAAGAFDTINNVSCAGTTQVGVSLDSFANGHAQHTISKIIVHGDGPDPF